MAGLNAIMLSSALAALRETGASALILSLDAVDDWALWRTLPDKKMLVLATQSPDAALGLKAHAKDIKAAVLLPVVKLTRASLMKLSTVICLTEGIVRSTDRVVCLAGLPGSGALDALSVLDLGRETEVFAARSVSAELLKRVRPEVIETVIAIALELASEGREGRSVGTTFVIGDHRKVVGLSRPLILNPFKGYPEEARNIMDSAMRETIKEFSLIDGAFIVREDGVVESAGVHLDAAVEEEGLMPGLGSRHMSAAGITDVTDAVAVTVSGSTGMVRMFRKGRIIMELERPSRRG